MLFIPSNLVDSVLGYISNMLTMNLIRKLFVFSLISSNLAKEAPIIGILTQETYIVDKYLPEKFDSFIAASYVKLLESAGARIVPIW